MIDTHAHIYDEAFDGDREEVIRRAKEAGITQIILPNVDSESLPRMLELEASHPGYCYAAIGLHPTSVKENWKEELEIVNAELKRRQYIAIGEIGIDLYWDKTYLQEQIKVFRQQIEWALEYQLPVIIHVRESFRETMDVLKSYKGQGLSGVFHSFTGDVKVAEEIINYEGLRLGINGIVTFKNSDLSDTLKNVDISHILTETDAPYLTPAPYRGKRNESAYTSLVCKKLAEIYELTTEEVDRITTLNAVKTFKNLLKQ